MLENWNLVCKCENVCSFGKYTFYYQDTLNFANKDFLEQNTTLLPY